MLVCLALFLLDGFCHLISYGYIFLKQWTALLELTVIIASLVLLIHNISHKNIRPKGVIRVLIIGVMY
jgi:hypothetical protein